MIPSGRQRSPTRFQVAPPPNAHDLAVSPPHRSRAHRVANMGWLSVRNTGVPPVAVPVDDARSMSQLKTCTTSLTGRASHPLRHRSAVIRDQQRYTGEHTSAHEAPETPFLELSPGSIQKSQLRLHLLWIDLYWHGVIYRLT